jgi:Mg-chelatase subunit ChlI
MTGKRAHVERDGVSVEHAARFLPAGTMDAGRKGQRGIEW